MEKFFILLTMFHCIPFLSYVRRLLHFHSRVSIGLRYNQVQGVANTFCCFGLSARGSFEIGCKKGAPVLIRGSERWLFCKTHKPSIAKSQPRLNILDRGLLVSGRLVGDWRYKKTRIREGIMAIVYERLGCFEEARWGLVDGLKSSTPGRDRKWCERAVQGKEFVATSGLHSSRRRGFEYK